MIIFSRVTEVFEIPFAISKT